MQKPAVCVCVCVCVCVWGRHSWHRPCLATSCRLYSCVCCSDVDLYPGAKAVANQAVVTSPIAIVYPQTLAAVQGAVNCSRQAGFPAVPRSGGHGYEGAQLHLPAPSAAM